MPDSKQTYPVRMGCDNCGHIAVYQIPMRMQIDEYDRYEDNYSAYRRRNSEDDTMIFCNNCRIPQLKILWWKDEEEAMHPQGVNNA